MNDSTVSRLEGKLTVGVDLGDRSSHCCVLDAEGTVMEEATVPTNQRAFRRWFSAKEPARVILEAGTHSHWVSRLAGDLGHEVIVANPRMLRFIYGSDSKNDRADAAYLARVGRLDPSLLRPIVHRSEAHQADRALLRSREALVRSRAHLITHVRAMVKVFGARLPRCSTDYFVRRVEGHVPDILLPALEPVLAIIATLTDRIRELERKIDLLARESYPETALLAQVSGVGTLTHARLRPHRGGSRPLPPVPVGGLLSRSSPPAAGFRCQSAAVAHHQGRRPDAALSPRGVRTSHTGCSRTRQRPEAVGPEVG